MNWTMRLLKAIIEWLRKLFGLDRSDGKDGRPLDEDEVRLEDLDLEEDRGLISPPIVGEPLYQCATAVTVRGFIAHAEIDIEVEGTVVITQVAGFPEPDGQSFPLPDPLVTDQVVRARQRFGSAQSDWSTPETVRDHTQDYPAGLPRPEVNPAPVYECGARTGVDNLLIGCNVWITADGTEVGRVGGAKEHQGVNVNPDYELAQEVRAWAELCKDPSPPSERYIAQPSPSPLPTPSIDTAYEGGEQIRITELANGARFTIMRGGVNQGTWRTWGQAHLVSLSPPLSSGEVLEISQHLCPGSDSPKGSTTVQACLARPAPVIGPIQDGDTRITLIEFVPDARIKVYVNGVKVGDGGGSIIQLTQPIRHGDTVHVLQIVGSCEGSTVREVDPQCVAPPVSYDPSSLNLFPVGYNDYDGGTTSIDGRTYSVKGTVYYPAEDDGQDTPFNRRLSDLGRVPIVLMAHGNHGVYRDPDEPLDESTGEERQSCSPVSGWVEIPNHEGYSYFQRMLARMGIVAVSVYSNETNCEAYGPTNMRHRAEVIIASIEHFQSLDSGGDPTFGGRIDFSNVGLVGHSRGGEAVVVLPEIISLPAVTIKAVISLAPTDAGASSGAPRDYSFMTILPAGDGDVAFNDGAKFYDQATPQPFKSQLYVHHTNHNFFNRQWLEDDGHGPPVMPRYDHERILSVYGCAFFRAVLFGHNTLGFLTGQILPSGVVTQHVHLSFEWKEKLVVDNHEDGNGIGLNSLDEPTAQSGTLTADEYTFARVGGAYNPTFFGNTTGMVAEHSEVMGTFRSQLSGAMDLSGHKVWVRASEVYNGSSVPTGATGFELGLEDTNGFLGWVDSDDVGSLPRPYNRRGDDLSESWPGEDLTKTMLKTLQFPAGCFQASEPKLDITQVRAILLRCNRPDRRALAFDDLHILPT